VDDIWDTVNLNAAKPPHGVFHRDIHQIWWFVATGSSDECDTRIIFDTALGRVVEFAGLIGVRGGWAKHTGPSAAARCSCAMSSTLGATMSVPLKPYIGRSTGTAIWKCDTGTTDAGTAYQSYIESKPYVPWGMKNKGSMPEEAIVTAKASSGAILTVTVIKDRGKETTPVTGRVNLTPVGSEAQVIKRAEGTKFSDAKSVQFRIGDASALDTDWNLTALLAEVRLDGAA
jgi:hypothetical protein